MWDFFFVYDLAEYRLKAIRKEFNYYILIHFSLKKLKDVLRKKMAESCYQKVNLRLASHLITS